MNNILANNLVLFYSTADYEIGQCDSIKAASGGGGVMKISLAISSLTVLSKIGKKKKKKAVVSSADK